MIFSELTKLNRYIKKSDYDKIKIFLDVVKPEMDDGQYDIDGERIYARVMSYDTKSCDECVIEAHKKYIDIQFSIIGSERIDVYSQKELSVQTIYDENTDSEFYVEKTEAEYVSCNNAPGKFTLLFPEDAHRPQVRTEKDNKVKKAVIKMLLESVDKSYCEDYLDIIRHGLDHTVVTDREGNVISLDDGMEIWALQAYKLQQYSRGLMFFCGNGASASMAEHMSHDWFQNACINTLTCSEISHITAISNDNSYDEVYSYRVKRVLSPNDIFIGISSSGNSANIVKAVIAAKDKNAFTVSVSGKQSDNKIRKMCDLNFYIPLDTYGEVESAHAVLLHMVLDYYLDKYMGGRH